MNACSMDKQINVPNNKENVEELIGFISRIITFGFGQNNGKRNVKCIAKYCQILAYK